MHKAHLVTYSITLKVRSAMSLKYVKACIILLKVMVNFKGKD